MINKNEIATKVLKSERDIRKNVEYKVNIAILVTILVGIIVELFVKNQIIAAVASAYSWIGLIVVCVGDLKENYIRRQSDKATSKLVLGDITKDFGSMLKNITKSIKDESENCEDCPVKDECEEYNNNLKKETKSNNITETVEPKKSNRIHKSTNKIIKSKRKLD